MAQITILTPGLVGTIVLGFILLALLVVAWAFFLDANMLNTAKVQSTMLSILGAATFCEVCFSLSGLTRPWVIAVALAVNLWGWLDALLRFDVAHDVKSCFAAKQLLCLVVKTLSYAFGIVGLREHIGKFLMVLLINIWGLPVLYLMALPLHPTGKVGVDERDVDLMVRMWKVTTCRTERQRCFRSSKKLMHKALFAVSQCSPTAKFALCAASPAYRRAFSKGCRSV
jgi:hypothetical protein